MSDLTTTLLACQNPNPSIRNEAEKALQNAESNNYAAFTLALSQELAAEGKDLTVRQLAGIHLKNLLVAKNDTLQQAKLEKWKITDVATRSAVKTLLLQSLISPETVARHTAAQACSEVAAIELPYNEWPEFLSALMEIVASSDKPDSVKVTSLECLGFTCERIATLGEFLPNISPDTNDRMLTTIVEGIRPDRPDVIRHAAAIALRNSLYFSAKNMETAHERNMIMQTICEATQSKEAKVRAAAYECIVQIALLYYDKLQDYMQILFQLTFQTIKNDEGEVALQAIEFWSTLCEEEASLMEMMDSENDDGSPRPVCVQYVAAAVPHLVPLLTESLTRQEEDTDGDEEAWNVSMASATCISLIATTVQDKIVPVIMPFVLQHIKNENWRFREAATMAFCSILEGPSDDVIGPYVNQSIPVLLAALSDPHIMVKDTTAWTIGRICELHARAIPQELFPTLLEGLISKLMTESPKVSSQACFALHNIAAAFADDDNADRIGTNSLSPYVPTLLQTFLSVVDRADADENNLRVTAFEAISVLIQNSAPDCRPILIQLLPVILGRLTTSFSISVLTNEEKEKKEGIQGLLCGIIQVITMKLGKDDIMPFSDSIMHNLIQVLQTKNATCHVESFSAISALCTIMEGDFNKYMQALFPFLMTGLTNFEAYHLCIVAVGLVGDISRSIEQNIVPYCQDIATALIQALQNPELHRSVKPNLLSCFGDLALAIGAAYEPYLQVSLMMLFQASHMTASPDDEELIEYINQLRESIVEAYTGIIQGLNDGNLLDRIAPYIDAVIGFLEVVAGDSNRNDTLLEKTIGLMGDIASTMGPRVKEYFKRPFVYALLREANETDDEKLVEISRWARDLIETALRS